MRFIALSLAGLMISSAAQAATVRLQQVGSWGIDLNDQDHSVRPGDDFSRFQNGAWMARTQLGPDRPNAAYWRDLRVKSSQDLAALLKDIAGPGAQPATAAERKAAALFRSAMDNRTIEARGLSPFAPELGQIRKIADRSSLAQILGRADGAGTIRNPTVRSSQTSSPFSLAIGQDQRDPTRRVVYIGQAGMMMAGPEYYLDPGLQDMKAAYLALCERTLRRLGWTNATQTARDIIALETQIASASRPREQMRDAAATYNPMDLRKLSATAPGFNWAAFLKGAMIPNDAPLVLDAPEAINRIAAIYAKTPLATLKARQAVGQALIKAPRLTSAFRDDVDQFTRLTRQGLQAPPTPEFLSEQWVESGLPDALSAIYVDRQSSPEIKSAAEKMAESLRVALDARISANAWLSVAGKQAARAKVAAMSIKIGYPDHFNDYRGLILREDDLYGNIQRIAEYRWRQDVASLHAPIDRSEWALTPFYPQYLYSVTTNSVEIPAALLIPPFFDLRADPAVNYGAIGTVIASTMLNGLDRGGIRYDPQGRLVAWFPDEDRAAIETIAHSLAARYSREEPLPDLHIKGDLVADEAMDDLGGIEVALDAMHRNIDPSRAGPIDGYSIDQRFFLARAQSWRAKFSTEFTRNQVTTGQNSPPYLRINGPLSNMEAWYSAFGVQPGDRLYIPPQERAQGW